MFARKDDPIATTLARLEAKLDQNTPPADHPYGETLQCWKRVSDRPCRCRAWMDVTQEGDGTNPSKRVQGCFFELFPWLISGAIVSSHEAMADVNALRTDVQEGLGGIHNSLVKGFNVLAQGMQLSRSPLKVLTEGQGTPALLNS